MIAPVARCVISMLLLLAPLFVRADVVTTRCHEREITSGDTRAAQLGACDDHASDLLWHLDRIDQVGGVLDGRADRANRGRGSVIYVMDTGILASHDEFLSAAGSRVIAGFDAAGAVPLGHSRCASDDKATAPCYSDREEMNAASHGTSVASIAAGRNIGVAPEAFLVSVRVMNERGLATTRTYLDGLDAIVRHAWSSGAPPFQTAVVNISGWVLEKITSEATGVVPFSAVEKKMLDMIAGVGADGLRHPDGKKFLFVVAANNVDTGCGDSGFVDRFPAILGHEIAGVITVGGMTAENEAWSGGCRGGVEILAPAQAIFSATISGNDHYRPRKSGLRSGTSFAAPVISGIAARMLAEAPRLTPQQLEAALVATPSRTRRPEAAYADGKVGVVIGRVGESVRAGEQVSSRRVGERGE
ncbi:MAG TPA: S8 family serine peptidase [Thermoanaerobaculia bacterium]|nr:S8 family serine peptidase [Thermoanaerobaculia bacterium]